MMNKKVDEEFAGIKDVYVLQCICTELNETRKKAIEYINTGEILNVWGEYKPFKKFGYGKDLLNILEGNNVTTNKDL